MRSLEADRYCYPMRRRAHEHLPNTSLVAGNVPRLRLNKSRDWTIGSESKNGADRDAAVSPELTILLSREHVGWKRCVFLFAECLGE